MFFKCYFGLRDFVERQIAHCILCYSGSNLQDLEKAIKECNWQSKIFSHDIKENVTGVLAQTPKGMARLSSLLETRCIEKTLPKEDLDDIIRQIADAAKTEMIDGKETRFVESRNNIVIVFRE